MTMVDHVISSLKADGNAMLLEVGLPWFRSLPISCVNGLIVTIGENSFNTDDLQIEIDGRFVSMTTLPDSDFGEWYLQDRKKVRVPMKSKSSELQKVRVQFDLVIANIFSGPNQPVHLPMIREVELQVI